MNHYRWRVADESDDFFCCPDTTSKTIIYARIYSVGHGYNYSETNQLIFNLKKPIHCSPPELHYKTQAIDKFANELAHLLTAIPNRTFTIIPIPPSKTKTHKDYDNRLEQVARKACLKSQNLNFLPLLVGTQDRDAAHLNPNNSRRVETVFNSMTLDTTILPHFKPDSTLIILDDISTSGASFEAAYQHLIRHYPSAKIMIIIWAKAKN